MVPPIILKRLAEVRGREKAVRLVWGLTRVLALAAGALLFACLLDWLIDLKTETPWGLRGFLLAAQGVLWIVSLGILVVRPMWAPLGDRDLALWTEDKFRELGHRLITAVELNRPGATVEGMSPELLAAATRQAEEMAQATDFARRVDLVRLKRGVGLALATAGVLGLVGAASPETVRVLLARQFLIDREIPRSVAVEAELAHQVRPSGEEVKLRFRAKGAVAFETLTGSIRLVPDGRPAEEYPLRFESKDGKGEATFAATIPAASVHFHYRGWLHDGRTRKGAEVTYVPRPVVQKIDAWVLLPTYVGFRPDGTPYEQYRVRGEIAGPLGSSARIQIEAQKKIVKGHLELLGRVGGEQLPETSLRSIPLAVGPDGRQAQGVLDIRSGETSYRVVVEDEYGFGNSTPPKRGIAIVPEEPPRVVLLPERFALPGDALLTDDAEVEGMPIPLGSAIRIAYYCAHPYGLDRARLAYRVIKAAKAAEDPGAPDVPWRYLPLGEVKATAEAGPFDLRRGHFEKTGFRDQVEFHPLPSPDPDHVHGRTEGGGCFDFQSKPLAGLQVGDQIELRVEVFARNPALTEPGRSEVRLKAFVTQAQFLEWMSQTLQHESRIRQLESRQRGVFSPEGDR
jgi:hypothetical protein